MHDDSPPYSNDRNSGPSSSQVARRRGLDRRWAAAEKSGMRKGLASWREMTDCGTTRRSAVAGSAAGSSGGGLLGGRLHAGRPQHLLLERLGGVRDRGVLREQDEEGGVAGGALREDRRDPVESLQLLGPVGLGAGGVRLDLGALVAHQQGDDLELRAHRGRHGSALDGGLDLAHGAGEHRDDALVVEVAGTTLSRRRTANARLALASSSQELLLRCAWHALCDG